MAKAASLVREEALRVILWLALAVVLLPIFWMVITSIKPAGIAQAIPPRWLFTPTLQNYADVLSGNTYTSQPFLSMVGNSVVVSLFSTLLTVLLATPAAYALARIRFKGRNFIALWILSTIMFPPAVSVIPIFILAGKLQLTDTYLVLIIPYTAFNLPIVIWMLRGFIQQIPVDIEEAAKADGASLATTLRRIVFPLLAPGIAASAILAAMLSWNEFLFAVTLTRSAAKTAPVGVNEFTSMYGTQWGDITAAAVVIAGPMLVIVLILRRRIIQGLTFGAVK